MVLALYEGLLKGKTHQLLHRNLGVTENWKSQEQPAAETPRRLFSAYGERL